MAQAAWAHEMDNRAIWDQDWTKRLRRDYKDPRYPKRHQPKHGKDANWMGMKHKHYIPATAAVSDTLEVPFTLPNGMPWSRIRSYRRLYPTVRELREL